MKKSILIFAIVLGVIRAAGLFAQQPYIIDTGDKNGSYCGTAHGDLKVIGDGINVIQWEEGDLVQGNFVVTSTYPNSIFQLTTFTYSLAAPYYKNFRALVTINGGSPTYSLLFAMKVDAPPTPGTLTGSAVYYLSGSGSLTYTGGYGALQWQKQTRFDPSWVNIDLPNTAYSLTETTEFRVVRSNGVCDPVATNDNVTIPPVKVEVFKLGNLTGPASVVEGERITLGAGDYYKSIIRWEYSTDDGNTWTEVPVTGPYRHHFTTNTKLRALIDLGPYGTEYTNILDVATTPYSQSFPSLEGENYVREQQIVVAGITNPNQISSGQKMEMITYMDGNGKAIQKVGVQESPLQKDVVQIIELDNQGRNSKQYLPYVSSASDGSFRSNAGVEQTSYYSNGLSDGVEDSPSPFAISVYEKSSLGRLIEQGSPGQQWQPGSGHTQRQTFSGNLANEVRLFYSDGSSSAFYDANELTKVESVDEDQKKKQEFVDKNGRSVLSRVQYDESGGSSLWLDTYKIYSEGGALKYIIPPNGVAALNTSGWEFNQAFKDKFVHEMVYDERGRLIEKKVPGQAWLYYCYDRLDRLVLAQDGKLRNLNKWIFIKYDGKNRPVRQGLYLNTIQTSRATMQQQVIDPLYSNEASPYFENDATTNFSFPTSNTEDLIINKYDSYEATGYLSQGLQGENTPGNALGLLTSTKRLILGTNTWLTADYYYDQEGRTIQVQSNNHLQTSVNDVVTVVYDFRGQMLYKKTYHDAGMGRVTTVLNTYHYDLTGRPTLVIQKNNTDQDVIVAKYSYNELGQLIEKDLHNAVVGQPFLQSIDYRYNIRGWLKSINNAQLSAESNDATNDYFGMELLYENTETGLNSGNNESYFNGSISAVKWKASGLPESAGTDGQRSYRFDYDKAGRMLASVSKMNNGTGWQKEVNAFNESATYDPNGNILTLARNQRQHQLAGLVASYVSATVDNLAYTYDSSQPDRLLKVTDATGIAAGFDNGASAANEDYEYEPTGTGNLLKDSNKGIDAITYNEFGKATLITFSDTRKIEYVYDAAGNKLSMKTYPTTASALPAKVTDYVNGFVYEDGALSFFGTQEGRVVKKSSGLEYQYAIADHQGNTRIVFSSAQSAPQTSTASMEDATNDAFQNYPTGGNRNSLSIYNHTTGGTYSQLLNGGNNSQVGVAKSMKVYPGDKVAISAYAKYGNPVNNSSNVSAFASALLEAFMLPAPLAGEAGTASTALNDWGSLVAAGGDGQSNAAPKVSVNIIVFDKNYNFLDVAFDQIDAGAQQVGVSPVVAHDLLTREYTIKEEGYVFMYIANENPTQVDAYFDDVSMTYTPTNIVQYNEYYPFGLQTANSWTRDGSSNNYLYNQANELNSNTGWYETLFRNYDPAIGRFTGVDPKATVYASHSAYHYAFNNPVMFNDPLGADPGYTGNYGTGGAWNPYTSGEYTWGAWGGPWSYYGPPPSMMDMTNEEWMFYSSPGGRPQQAIEMGLFDLENRAIMNRIRNDNGYFLTPAGDWVSAREVLAVNNPNQNPLWRSLAQKAMDEQQGGSSDGLTTAAVGVLAFISTDATIPEPTDAFWPKWAVYAAAGAVAGVIVYNSTTTKRKSAQDGAQYTLRARTSGFYPTMIWGSSIPSGTVYLNAGDVWKIGETMQYDAVSQKQWRYTRAELNGWNVEFVPEFTGSKTAIKAMESLKLIGYFTTYGTLPAGNKGLK